MDQNEKQLVYGSDVSRWIERMNDLYISYRQRFIVAANGMMFMPKNKEGAVKLTNPYLYKHLTGGYAIGVFAGEKRSKFMCFDVDDGNVESVVAIMSALEVFGINKRFISVSSSGGKGYHIEIFFDELMPTELQRRVYDWTLSKTGLNRREIEFRPTHGQAIKLPLGVHHKTGNVCWFLDQETFEPIESYDFIAHVEKMPAGDFIRIVNDLPVQHVMKNSTPSPKREPIRRVQPKNIPTPENPYSPITVVSTRHNAMLRLAIALRHDGSTVELCEEKMQAWYREQDKRLIKSTEEEIFADIKDILKWVYSDRFILKHRRREEIRTEEILFTLRPKTKTARKMLFLITAMCNDYGKCTLTYDRLMKALGCSRQTVAANLKSLEDSGFIRCMKKTPKYEDGKFIRECNSYYVSRETIGTVSEPDEEHRAVSVALRLGRLLDDFDQTYYGLLVQALSEEELRKARFSISERKILAEIVNAREVGSRSAF